MLLLDSNHQLINWNYSKYYHRKDRPTKSSGHTLALSLLGELFPNHTIYEEVSLPTCPVMYADFWVPNIKLIVEVQGKQHYEYTPHFHKDKMDFYRAQARDKKKRNWCELNEIKLIQLSDEESDTWKQTIINSLK